MMEIMPNSHPIFVHFTVALVSTATLFALLAYGCSRLWVNFPLFKDWETVSKWSLWLAGLMTLFTVSAGLHAFNTVDHDAISHAAMTIHRNWALPTSLAVILLAMWAGWRSYRQNLLSFSFILALAIVEGLVLTTAWYGAELVFRYGLGVESLPKTEAIGHAHQPTSPSHNQDNNDSNGQMKKVHSH